MGRPREDQGRGGREDRATNPRPTLCVSRSSSQPWLSFCRVVAPSGPQGHVHQGDKDRNLDERTDDAGESLAARDAEHAYGDRDRQLEVVARCGEREGGGALVGEASALRARKTRTT